MENKDEIYLTQKAINIGKKEIKKWQEFVLEGEKRIKKLRKLK